MGFLADINYFQTDPWYNQSWHSSANRPLFRYNSMPKLTLIVVPKVFKNQRYWIRFIFTFLKCLKISVRLHTLNVIVISFIGDTGLLTMSILNSRLHLQSKLQRQRLIIIKTRISHAVQYNIYILDLTKRRWHTFAQLSHGGSVFFR